MTVHMDTNQLIDHLSKMLDEEQQHYKWVEHKREGEGRGRIRRSEKAMWLARKSLRISALAEAIERIKELDRLPTHVLDSAKG